MVRPVLLVVDDEADSLRALSRELDSRYGAHYRVVARASAEDALATLAEFRAEGVAVPVVLADQWMPETTGIDLLARVRELYPTGAGCWLPGETGRPPHRSWRPRRWGRWTPTFRSRRGRRTRNSTCR